MPPLDVNHLRRRPVGPRLLVLLDQSTLSELACNEKYAKTRELLASGVDACKLICPGSPGVDDETFAAEGIWQDISDLQDELSMGINFRGSVDDRR